MSVRCLARRLAFQHACVARSEASARPSLQPGAWSTTSAGAILRAHSRSTRVGRGGSHNLPVITVAAPVLSTQFYRAGGWGVNPQYKPSSIKPASGSDLHAPTQWPA